VSREWEEEQGVELYVIKRWYTRYGWDDFCQLESLPRSILKINVKEERVCQWTYIPKILSDINHIHQNRYTINKFF